MSSELMKLADGFSLIAEGIREMAKTENNISSVKPETKAGKTQSTNKSDGPNSQKEEPESEVSIEDIRAVLAEKSQDGKTGKVRELLQQFGVVKLSAVAEKDYPELMQKAKVL